MEVGRHTLVSLVSSRFQLIICTVSHFHYRPALISDLVRAATSLTIALGVTQDITNYPEMMSPGITQPNQTSNVLHLNFTHHSSFQKGAELRWQELSSHLPSSSFTPSSPSSTPIAPRVAISLAIDDMFGAVMEGGDEGEGSAAAAAAGGRRRDHRVVFDETITTKVSKSYPLNPLPSPAIPFDSIPFSSTIHQF